MRISSATRLPLCRHQTPGETGPAGLACLLGRPSAAWHDGRVDDSSAGTPVMGQQADAFFHPFLGHRHEGGWIYPAIAMDAALAEHIAANAIVSLEQRQCGVGDVRLTAAAGIALDLYAVFPGGCAGDNRAAGVAEGNGNGGAWQLGVRIETHLDIKA